MTTQHNNAVELIRLAKKNSYQITEGFRDSILPREFELSPELGAQMRAAAIALSRASGVSLEVAEVTVMEVAIKEHLARLAEQQSN